MKEYKNGADHKKPLIDPRDSLNHFEFTKNFLKGSLTVLCKRIAARSISESSIWQWVPW